MSNPRTIVTILGERVVKLEDEVFALREKLDEARKENDLLQEERDAALLEVDRLRMCSE